VLFFPHKMSQVILTMAVPWWLSWTLPLLLKPETMFLYTASHHKLRVNHVSITREKKQNQQTWSKVFLLLVASPQAQMSSLGAVGFCQVYIATDPLFRTRFSTAFLHMHITRWLSKIKRNNTNNYQVYRKYNCSSFKQESHHKSTIIFAQYF